MKPVYAIRHKHSGYYLPNPKGKNGSGGSFVEPVNPDVELPRLFLTHRSANSALTQWLKGHHIATWDCGDEGPAFVDSITLKPQPNRHKEDWEIVEIHLHVR